ncbi:hypothetical protein PC118_g13336 [Phytophthora cactorum]|uniref:VPS9 domain-containing protein n=1 Tax=Phytophthora cactorum TaxID=29920 RepID=A0A8T1FPW5_9STRA|nr:hypothetical protein PC118_g13336 [Phytophthora cactorum]
MGDVFLHALSADLEQTQRALPPRCLFCVPQPRSLLADEDTTQDTLYTHFLTPADDELERPLGSYDTLNGKQVAVLGSHIHTGKGFSDRRQVRILLSEKREIQHQEVTVLHISRPLEGGLEVPEDPSEIDVATLRKYTAILRSFPENELVFYQLGETISQVHKICVQEQVYERYKQTLPANLREEWEAAVEELIHAGSFDDVEEDYRLQRRHGGGVSHLLQIQQVVECYLMESLHDVIFPRIVVSCQEQDKKLQQVLYRMRQYTPEDFGLRKEFQCFTAEARDTLLTVTQKKTPLDMLLVFKACIDRVSDAITRNVKLRRLDFEAYQLTTDDILDQLLFVLVQAFNKVLQGSAEGATGSASPFPIVAVIKYISDYHFINSNTTALGFTIANFQVAIEYFLMRGDHEDDCKDCADLALQDGRVFSWGCSTYGKLGRASEGLLDMVQPRQVDAVWTGWAMDMKSRLSSGERYVVRRIAAGKDHSLAISSDGAVFTWGRGDSGQLGHGCYMDVSEPKQVMAISAAISEKCGLIDIAGGNDFSIFLLQNGTAYICGRDPSLDIEKLHLSPSLLTLPSTLEGEFFGQIAAPLATIARRRISDSRNAGEARGMEPAKDMDKLARLDDISCPNFDLLVWWTGRPHNLDEAWPSRLGPSFVEMRICFAVRS